MVPVLLVSILNSLNIASQHPCGPCTILAELSCCDCTNLGSGGQPWELCIFFGLAGCAARVPLGSFLVPRNFFFFFTKRTPPPPAKKNTAENLTHPHGTSGQPVLEQNRIMCSIFQVRSTFDDLEDRSQVQRPYFGQGPAHKSQFWQGPAQTWVILRLVSQANQRRRAKKIATPFVEVARAQRCLAELQERLPAISFLPHLWSYLFEALFGFLEPFPAPKKAKAWSKKQCLVNAGFFIGVLTALSDEMGVFFVEGGLSTEHKARGTFHVHSEPKHSDLSRKPPASQANSWCWKRRIVEKNGWDQPLDS